MFSTCVFALVFKAALDGAFVVEVVLVEVDVLAVTGFFSVARGRGVSVMTVSLLSVVDVGGSRVATGMVEAAFLLSFLLPKNWLGSMCSLVFLFTGGETLDKRKDKARGDAPTKDEVSVHNAYIQKFEYLQIIVVVVADYIKFQKKKGGYT